MKKHLTRCLICMGIMTLILGLGISAYADAVTGMVEEINREGLILYTEEGTRFIVFSEKTVWNTNGEVVTGDVITVNCTDPINHRILKADTVTRYSICGTIAEISNSDEPYLVLITEGNTSSVKVNLGRILSHGFVSGYPVTVYYDGIQSRSNPPQIFAEYIRGTVLHGKIIEKAGNAGFILRKEDGETVLLHISDETIILAETAVGNTVSVSVYPWIRLSNPAQYEVQDILNADSL